MCIYIRERERGDICKCKFKCEARSLKIEAEVSENKKGVQERN